MFSVLNVWLGNAWRNVWLAVGTTQMVEISECCKMDKQRSDHTRGYRGGSPTAVRPSEPALCGSRPLVIPYYCRLGDLLCFVFIVGLLYVWFFCVIYIPSVLWYCWLGLLTCKNRLPYNLYCVGGDVRHCSINQSIRSYVHWVTDSADFVQKFLFDALNNFSTSIKKPW